MDRDPTPGEAWDGYASELQARYDRWMDAARQVSAIRAGGGADVEYVANTYRRLIPLVEEMKQYPILRSLYPFTSHRWLGLGTLPPPDGESMGVRAEATAEGRFLVTRVPRQRLPGSGEEERLGEGDAPEMARLIADEVARARASGGRGDESS